MTNHDDRHATTRVAPAADRDAPGTRSAMRRDRLRSHGGSDPARSARYGAVDRGAAPRDPSFPRAVGRREADRAAVGVRPQGHPRGAVAAHRRHLADESRARYRRDAPVSYTHLRAHETPEHLVCRLL